MGCVNEWDSPAAFDDISEPYQQADKKTAQWGLYRPVRSHMHYGKGYCSIHLYLVNTKTGEEAELYFNNVIKGKGGLHSVKRKSAFAKLYIDCFGEVNPRRFSKANQLMKHFHNKPCLLFCKTETATRSNGEIYNKVTEQKSGNVLETNRKPSGNLLETDWKPQTAERLINTRPREQSQVIDKYLIEDSEIKQYNSPLSNGNKNEYKVMNEMRGFTFTQMPNETTGQLYERVINETF